MFLAWKPLAAAALGVAAGLGALVFRLSEAPSYLPDRPETCVNCHIMRPQFATWRASSHRGAATCNDCHVPHDSQARKYFFKASDGLRHAAIFTLRTEPQVIRIHAAGSAVVQENCLRCHGQIVDGTPAGRVSFTAHASPGRRCVDCHRETPHGLVESLSSAPNARVQRLDPLGAQLLKEKP